MKQKTTLLPLILWLAISSLAAFAAKQTNPIDLKKGANVIINKEETVFAVASRGSATTTFKTRITILNENGLHRAKLYVPYDKLTKVVYVKGTSYDTYGVKLKTLKNSDIVDVSAITDNSLFADNRVKIANLSHTMYPFTVEFEYQVTTTNMLFYPTWAPLDEESLSVEKSVFVVTIPAGLKLRYREANLQQPVAMRTEAGQQVFTWEVSNLAPFKSEPYMPPMAELVPMVRTAPTDFEVEGYAGNMETWLNYGQWINKLNAGRDVLPEATKTKIAAIVADAKTPEEKAKRIYSYLQNNTRYISIQLGIGGWQPFEASFVDGKGYGDCKALTNYTQAMLKTVGIDSYHALIRAGDDVAPILSDFPGQQFNHVILSVPMEKDTLWLECTSQHESAGYTGSFTGNRKALLVTPEGGKLVNTLAYTATDNAQYRTATVKLDEKGNGTANVQTRYTGLSHEDHRDVIQNASPENQRKWLYKNIDIPAFEIQSFAFDLKKGKLPEVNEKLDLNLRQVATLSGKRMFLAPNLMNKWDSTPNAVENRKWDVMRASAYTNTDIVTYEMPAGYTLEYKPTDTNYKTAFGTFKTITKVDGQKVTYERTLQMNKGRFKPEAYAQMLEFMNNIVKADGQQLVFVKNVQ